MRATPSFATSMTVRATITAGRVRHLGLRVVRVEELQCRGYRGLSVPMF